MKIRLKNQEKWHVHKNREIIQQKKDLHFLAKIIQGRKELPVKGSKNTNFSTALREM